MRIRAGHIAYSDPGAPRLTAPDPGGFDACGHRIGTALVHCGQTVSAPGSIPPMVPNLVGHGRLANDGRGAYAATDLAPHVFLVSWNKIVANRGKS
jgi:hypothetical protein